MTSVRLTFPAGRYHANPWGRHVNEGVAEWPPSPYRLLRALYDVWQRKRPDLEQAAVEGVLEALGSAEPSFELPRATASHTRSYLSSNSEDPTAKNLVFDAFVALEPDRECLICWPELDLTPEQRAVLSGLLEDLNYLGRSESWVTASLTNRVPGRESRCDPVAIADYDGEAMPVACVVSPAEYKGRGRWPDALTTSTTEVSKRRISAPPLLMPVRYLRRVNAIETDPVSAARRRRPDVEAVMLGLDSTVLPLATSTIEVAEQIRVRLMGAHRTIAGENNVSSLFSGKQPDGTKRDDHGHLYILPLSNEAGRIDRVLMLSRRHAFKLDELNAVCRVNELYQSHGRPAVRCVLTWQGKITESDILKPADAVVSATPFVTARHWRRGRDFEQFLQDEIRRECRNHGLPEPVQIERKREDDRVGLFHTIEYRRNRKQDPSRPGYLFRLRFDQSVLTPFSLGYASHFGLGQFKKED